MDLRLFIFAGGHANGHHLKVQACAAKDCGSSRFCECGLGQVMEDAAGEGRLHFKTAASDGGKGTVARLALLVTAQAFVSQLAAHLL